MRGALLTAVVVTLLSSSSALAESTEVTSYRLTGARIALGQDIRVEPDEEVTDAAVVVGGSLDVQGRVRDGVVVVGGDLRLGPKSDVRGDIVLVGGQLIREDGSRHVGSVNYISFGNWSQRALFWMPTVDFGDFGSWIRLFGTLGRLSLLAVLMAVMLIIARAPVARTGRAALAEPLRAGLVGFAAELFFIPLLVATSIALAITIVGIPFVAILVPGAIIVAGFALVLGFTALACRLGEWLEDRLGWRPGNAFVATAIGFVAIMAPTLAARLFGLVPFLQPLSFSLLVTGLAFEFVAWTIGFGAAILTGLGRWYTVPPPITAKPTQPTPSAAY